jgi:hypothetical protein
VNIEFGRLDTLDTRGTGWFLGYGDWLMPERPGDPGLRYMPRDAILHTLCMKWGVHEKGSLLGAGKPKSEGRTLSILVSEGGRFRLEFSASGDFSDGDRVGHVLDRHGHFCAWGEDLHHRWFVDEDCVILTLRWIPVAAPPA